MTSPQKALASKLQKLEEENRSLRETCESLQQTQGSYEEIISDSNQNLLRSDMARMELEQIFSAYTDPMWVIREDGIVLRANAAMLELLGKSSEELIGNTCSIFMNFDLCDQSSCPLKTIQQPENCEHDIKLQTADGEQRNYLLTAAPLITLDGTPGVVVQFKDITQRKQMEEALEQANQELSKIAHIDGLTQIANRRSFDQGIDKEWLRLKRDEKPLSLLLCDIDFFKKYNDHYGHQAGDQCLKQVAQALESAVLRPADLAARYGGEEFALLLPDAPIEGALQVGERVMAAIAQLAIEHQQSQVGEFVTLSIGVATLTPTAEQNPAELIALADDALYKAKEQGRNRIVPASQPIPAAVAKKVAT